MQKSGSIWAVFNLFWRCFGAAVQEACRLGLVHVCLCVKYGALLVFSLFVATRGPPYLTSQHFMGCQAACSLQKPQLISAFVFGSKYTCVDDACVIILALEATQLCAVCMYVSLCSE